MNILTPIKISPYFWRNIYNNQSAGFWLFQGSRHCFDKVAPTLGQLLFWAIVAVAANTLFSWLSAEAQGHFNAQGIISYLLWPMIAMICGIFLAQHSGQSRLMLVPPVLWLVVDTHVALIQCVLQFLGQHDALPELSYAILPHLFMLIFVWQSLAIVWVISRLMKWPWWERGLILAATLFTLVVWQVSSKSQPIWKIDEVPVRFSEAALYAQSDLLNQNLATLQRGSQQGIAPQDSSQHGGLQAKMPNYIPTQWYFLGVAGAGYQDVFKSEVERIRQQFDHQFGTASHSIALINNDNTLTQFPMATRTSIQRSLNVMAGLMDKDRDVLFLYLTSHGLHNQFELTQDPIDLDNIDPQWLKNALDGAGIRWRVIVISSCYSGSFIPALQTPETLIITASRADRTSFGCGNESDYTYFGRAFFDEGLNHSNSLKQAFDQASVLVHKWETAQAFEPSEPQWILGSAIAQRLPQFEHDLFMPSTVQLSDHPTQATASPSALLKPH